MNQIAITALSQAEITPSLAGILARKVEAARRFIASHKRTLLGLVHPDIPGSAELTADSAEISAAFTVLEGLEDEELVEALRLYASMFTNQTAAILSMQQQLTDTVEPLQSLIVDLEAELTAYKKDEGWLINEAVHANDLEVLALIDQFAAITHRRREPTDLPEELGVALEVSFDDLLGAVLTTELVPLRDASTQEVIAHESIGNYADGPEIPQLFQVGLVTVAANGRVKIAIRMPAKDRRRDRNWVELGEMFDAISDDPLDRHDEHPADIGVLLGFLNMVELGEGEVRPSRWNDLISEADTYFSYELPLAGVSQDLLPFLSRNGLVRHQLDPFTDEPVKYRVRSTDPGEVTYDASSYLVALQGQPDAKTPATAWRVTFVPIAAIRRDNER